MDTFDDQGNKKNRSGKGLIIALVAVLAVLILASAGFLLREIIRSQPSVSEGTRSGNEPRATLAENDHQQETSEARENPTAVPAALGESDEIKKAETSGKAYVIDVSEVVERVMPCVVSIVDTLETTQSSNPYSFFFGGDSGSSQISSSSGSGVIIGQKGDELLIVTNNHVVSNESSSGYTMISSKGLTVTFCDGATADAQIRGTDVNTDLAVISVKLSAISSETKDTIRMAVLGSSDEAAVGSGVIVIGNAGGYGQSVTSGIISAKDRSVTIDNITRLLIQTDAAINPGNSGGGMFNASGELIGIACAKTVSTNIEGMGFAIPITSVKTVIENLMNQEPIPEGEEGYLGINGASVPSNYITSYGYPAGVSITRIIEGSPAELAGLQIYDIIAEVNGQAVTTMNELKAVTNSYPAGTTISLKVYRSVGRTFKEFTVEATLVKASELSTGNK
ncbi:MAG: trypsin-like peptidase domain-containing protein [Lachnospiraceae bacterium]|nr:trypsin-like peptidase domain-containing protein [Lachnospiraceae bacterium]